MDPASVTRIEQQHKFFAGWTAAATTVTNATRDAREQARKLATLVINGFRYISTTLYRFEFVSLSTMAKYIFWGPVVLAALLSVVASSNNLALLLQSVLQSA